MRAPRLVEQFEDLDKQAHAAHLGMWAFLGSELLLFAGLFALYAAYRVTYPVDFELAVERNNVAIGTGNTLILITSSFTVALALHAVRGDRPRRAAALLLFSIACGIAFLLLKGIEYAHHFHEGIFPGASYRYAGLPTGGAKVFFTLYYLLTGLHAIHVVAGLVVLSWLTVGCLSLAYSSARHVHLELGALYWHLVDVVWIFLWPMLYLMHR
jgi:cytochrome c oxidase subunit 3